MNIVKLKDIVMPSEFKMSEFFNTKLKGRYAFWIQMRYIFPLESLCYQSYIKLEQLDPMDFLKETMPTHIDLYSEEYCMIDFVHTFVDLCATEDANNIYNFIASNKYATDADIDMNHLRSFRSWLAGELLKLNEGIYEDHLGKYTPEQIHMLEFYKNNMYNDVLKYLDIFGKSNATFNVSQSNTSSCSCCNNALNIYDITNVNSCNSSTIYINNIHKLMVSTFEDPNFWTALNVDFIKVFKLYIDNILKAGMNVNIPSKSNKFNVCSCSTSNDNNTSNILSKLSTALGYIIDNEHKGHMNFIHDALYDWAEYLYDYMSWEVK